MYFTLLAKHFEESFGSTIFGSSSYLEHGYNYWQFTGCLGAPTHTPLVRGRQVLGSSVTSSRSPGPPIASPVVHLSLFPRCLPVLSLCPLVRRVQFPEYTEYAEAPLRLDLCLIAAVEVLHILFVFIA